MQSTLGLPPAEPEDDIESRNGSGTSERLIDLVLAHDFYERGIRAPGSGFATKYATSAP